MTSKPIMKWKTQYVSDHEEPEEIQEYANYYDAREAVIDLIYNECMELFIGDEAWSEEEIFQEVDRGPNSVLKYQVVVVSSDRLAEQLRPLNETLDRQLKTCDELDAKCRRLHDELELMANKAWA